MSKAQGYDHLVKLLLIGDSGEFPKESISRILDALPHVPRSLRPVSLQHVGASPVCCALGLASLPLAPMTFFPPNCLPGPGVGKSCLLLRFSEDQFTSSFITTIGCARCALRPSEVRLWGTLAGGLVGSFCRSHSACPAPSAPITGLISRSRWQT